MTTPTPLEPLIALRRELHRLAEPSGNEARTAARVTEVLSGCGPTALHQNVGGHGVLAWWDGPHRGPTVLLRAELDAVPVGEQLPLTYASATPGTAHKCGHDGHMTTLLGLAAWLAGGPFTRGRVALLFQGAEETGEGAASALASPAMLTLSPDWVFALHNLPGVPLGQVVLREGLFAMASTGLEVKLQGSTSHAAEPERGNSPALALSHLISALSALPQDAAPLHEPVKATVVHAHLGAPALGTTPGEALLLVTLRAGSDAALGGLRDLATARAHAIAAGFGLSCDTREVEPFPATWNHPQAVHRLRAAAASLGLAVAEPPHPFPWSEDFGHLSRAFPGALFGLGSGEEHPALHHPRYDFPDPLIGIGLAIFQALLAPLNGAYPPAAPLCAETAGAGIEG